MSRPKPVPRAAPILLILLLAIAVPPTARAGDRVVMKSGAIFRGKIVQETEAELIMDIPGLGRVRLVRERILDIEPGEAEAAPAEPAASAEAPSEERVAEPAEGAPDRAGVEIPYDRLRPGLRVLVLLRGADHGSWLETGKRYLGEVAMVTKTRLKVVFDEERGALGNAWIRRDTIDRIANPGAGTDRLILFLEDVELGAWVTCRTGDGRMLGGQLTGFSDGGRMTLRVPHAAGAETVDVTLGDLRVLSAVVRRPDATKPIEELRAGEPVRLTVANRAEPLTGRLVSRDDEHMILAVATKPGGDDDAIRIQEMRVFLGWPIVKVERLPERLRAAFEGAEVGDHIEVIRIVEDEEQTVRTIVEGALVHATPDAVLLRTADGTEEFRASTLRRARRILGDEATAATRKPESNAKMKLDVLPGMDRETAEAALPADSEGIDVLYGPEGVEKVYCRWPFAGPLFGIRLGERFDPQLENTDLVFQERRTPKTGGDLALTTVVSRTLTPYVVTFLLDRNGVALAAEIAGR